jgi:phosphoglycolate phosphatase
LSETIQLLVPQITKGELALAIAAFRRLYDSSDYPSTDLMPHAAEVLCCLRLKGKHLFVASNKASKPALRILSKLRLDDFFQAVYTVDSLPDRRMKKHEMVHAILNNFALMNLKTAIVGDMVSDIEAAREAGIRSFAFLGGYGIEAELKSAKPDRCIADLRQLID